MEQEQDANFISRLHGGKLDIIPWPVIESKEFYKLFTVLKRRLDQQKISHPTAGEFLHRIKTLMAKLKVGHTLCCPWHCSERLLQTNDWGALSRRSSHHFLSFGSNFSTETMAEHRAKSLSALLPITLATGFLETELESEPLKVP